MQKYRKRSCGHANIFHLWGKYQLSWIAQITWICYIHFCITIQSNSQNIKQCSISNSLYVQPLTQCSACGRQSVFGRSRSWRMLGFCLSEYCDFIQQGIILDSAALVIVCDTIRGAYV
jgi:hypothetical protein